MLKWMHPMRSSRYLLSEAFNPGCAARVAGETSLKTPPLRPITAERAETGGVWGTGERS